jgi:DNA processing protein
LIYALSDAALVVNSDFEKGGTWAGAVEQLEKLHLVPLFVRSDQDSGKGLKALQQKGALGWPNPEFPEELIKTLAAKLDVTNNRSLQKELPLYSAVISATANQNLNLPENVAEQPAGPYETPAATSGPADELFATVKSLVLRLYMPGDITKTEIAVADALQVSKKQAKEWLDRMVKENILVHKIKPSCYCLATEKQDQLFRIPDNSNH